MYDNNMHGERIKIQ